MTLTTFATHASLVYVILIQTAERKKAALMVMFSCLSNSDFKETEQKTAVCIFSLFQLSFPLRNPLKMSGYSRSAPIVLGGDCADFKILACT